MRVPITERHVKSEWVIEANHITMVALHSPQRRRGDETVFSCATLPPKPTQCRAAHNYKLFYVASPPLAFASIEPSSPSIPPPCF